MKKREVVQLSNEKCACGCGQFISVRTARAKAKGVTKGYIFGHIWKGRKIPEYAKVKMRLNHADVSGEKNPNYGKGLFGERNPNWQGGKTIYLYRKNNQIGINTKKDIEFRHSIMARDKKCVLCGNISKLNTHHIEPWVEAPELRFNSLNVVTLCKSCHVRIDNKHHKEIYKPMLKTYTHNIYNRKAEDVFDKGMQNE